MEKEPENYLETKIEMLFFTLVSERRLKRE